MPLLPSAWNSREAVPEALRDFVVEKGGKFVLEGVEGFEPKERVDEFRTNNLRFKEDVERLQGQLKGALSAEDAERLKVELEEAKSKLDAGVYSKRVEELLAQRIATVRIGERDVTVLKSDKPVLETLLKGLSDRESSSSDRLRNLTVELAKERIDGAARAAMASIGGFKENAHDDVVRSVREVFRMGDDFTAFLPDLEADKEGKVAKVDASGKPLTVEGYLRQIVESGKKGGVWVEEARGPGGKKVTPAAPKQTDTVHGTSRIARGLAARQKS